MSSGRARWGRVLFAASLILPGLGLPAHASSGGSCSVVVSVPEVPYVATTDTFVIGSLNSTLDVLFNDSGFPDPTSVELVDADGALVDELGVPGLGTLTVHGGLLHLTQAARIVEGRYSVAYQARSANGSMQRATVTIARHARVISTVDDTVVLEDGAADGTMPAPVSIDVASNDTILVPGAVRRCLPTLSTTRPNASMTVHVLPEPERPEPTCASPRPLVTKQGTWLVSADGQVEFRPLERFHGTASVYYRQDTDFPTDIGVARITVRSPSTAPSRPDAPHNGRPPASAIDVVGVVLPQTDSVTSDRPMRLTPPAVAGGVGPKGPVAGSAPPRGRAEGYPWWLGTLPAWPLAALLILQVLGRRRGSGTAGPVG